MQLLYSSSAARSFKDSVFKFHRSISNRKTFASHQLGLIREFLFDSLPSCLFVYSFFLARDSAMLMKSVRSPMPPSVHYVEVNAESSDKAPASAPEVCTSSSIVEVDALDCKGKWYQAFIIEGSTDHSASVRIHFMGWDSKWDETIPRSNFGSHIRPRSQCDIGPKGHEALENVRLTHHRAGQAAVTSGTAVIVESCEETFALNAIATPNNSWLEERCILLSTQSSNLRVRAEPSAESPIVGLLNAGKKFWFTKIVGSWAKLSPLHYHDLSQAVLCSPKDFKPHDPVNIGWCLMKSAQGEVLLADSTHVPVPVTVGAFGSSSAAFGGVAAHTAAPSSSFGLGISRANPPNVASFLQSSGLSPMANPSLPFGSSARSSPPFGSVAGSFPGFSLPLSSTSSLTVLGSNPFAATVSQQSFSVPPSPFSFGASSSSSLPAHL